MSGKKRKHCCFSEAVLCAARVSDNIEFRKQVRERTEATNTPTPRIYSANLRTMALIAATLND